MNKSFWEFWVVDSALRGKDPIARFLIGLYQGLWIPFVVLAFVCIFLDLNYFLILGLIFKAVWDCWIKTIWFALTHWDVVVYNCRRAVFPGYGE